LSAEVRSVWPPAAQSEEADWIARIRSGDEPACEALYRRYHEALWRFAYAQVRSADVAEELVHEVFLALWRDRAQWEVTTSARAWLYGAVRNQAMKHLRHERVVARFAERGARHAAGADGGSAMIAHAGDVQRALEGREVDAAVERAIAALPERRRIAMTLRWRHELGAPEIARVLGTTPEAVRVLLTRARHELAGLLARVRGV
jgi:RNA polymerase sigma-70 factor (ECF subfamily)